MVTVNAGVKWEMMLECSREFRMVPVNAGVYKGIPNSSSECWSVVENSKL